MSTLAYTVVYSACKCTVCYRVNSVMMFPSQNLSQMILSGDIQNTNTLESGRDVGQGITVVPGKFVKNNKRRALNKHRA